MTGKPVEPIPPEAMLGPSDWDDEDLLTVAEASERLAEEIRLARDRIRQAEEVFAGEDGPVFRVAKLASVAAERDRLDALVRAAERIRTAQANAPR